MFTSVQQDEDKEKGDSDGYYECKRLFTCPKKGGIFVPFSSLEKVIPRSPSPEVPLEPVQLSAGDRVTYSSTSELRHGMVLGVKEKDGQTVVQISTVSPHTHTFTILGRQSQKGLKQAVAVSRTPMKMEKRVERLKFCCSVLLGRRCQQV